MEGRQYNLNQKVSVVVPIYKVEKYLRRCVESILNQTYSDLEIILVDDGSPDNCGIIADQYANLDSRIMVAHKENGGLSDARNYGMRYVTGEYTLFVDSDDWLEANMVEELVRASTKYQADIVQTAFYYAYDHYLLFDNRVYSKGSSSVILNNKTAMAELVINERVKNFAWGKLYKTKIIHDITFEKGVLFEDVFWAHKVMQRVKTFVSINSPFYYYYQREDSIVSNYSLRNLDIIRGLKERHLFIEKYYRDLTDESYKVILKTNLIHYNLLLRNKEKDSGGLFRREIKHYIKNNLPKFKKAVEDDKHLKKQLFLFNIHPYLNVINLLIDKVLRKIKVIPQPIGLQRIDLE
jgi:glycosyltransferase involved in cell wall biosynthesis